jgi:hypothetical protein
MFAEAHRVLLLFAAFLSLKTPHVIVPALRLPSHCTPVLSRTQQRTKLSTSRMGVAGAAEKIVVREIAIGLGLGLVSGFIWKTYHWGLMKDCKQWYAVEKKKLQA